MNKLVPLLALALLAQAAGCRKKDPAPDPPTDPLSQLPPETQTGQRTFGCLVNGHAWTPAGNPFGGPLLSCSYMTSRLAIVANRVTIVNGSNHFQRISLVLDRVSQHGNYVLNDSSSQFARYENDDTACNITTTPTQIGSLEIIKLDPVARIVSGRFSFTLETPGCGKAVVTDGRFDCPF